MPYKISHSGSGYKVTTPNHPHGFSKHPMSKQKAVAQLRAIKMNTDEDLAQDVVIALLDGIDQAELAKGTRDEEKEHDMPPKKARKTALQHLTRVDPHYYTKTEKCLDEKPPRTRAKADIMPGGSLGTVGGTTNSGLSGIGGGL